MCFVLQKSGEKNCILRLNCRPAAEAELRGDVDHPHLRGIVLFYPCGMGTVVLAEVSGLPYDPSPCASNLFAMHLHAGGTCEPDKYAVEHGEPSFSETGGHFNPLACPHPAHAGDLPPLFGNRGYAWMGVFTERFRPEDVIGKTVILHAQRDDFISQPAGDAGKRIACGVVKRDGKIPLERD